MLLLLLCSVASSMLLSQTQAAFKCGKEEFGYKGSCYLFNTSYVTWHEAQELCVRKNGTLTDIRDSDEQNFIQEHISTNSWIGLHDMFQADKFQWLSDNSEANFTNWNVGEPNNAQENCAVIKAYGSPEKGTWNDIYCRKHFYFICEKSAVAGTGGPCNAGWKNFTGHCYNFNRTAVSWEKARRSCQDVGADLVRVDSEAENEFLRVNVQFSRSDHWIGLHEINSWNGPGTWVWLDQTTEISYQSWRQGEPNDANTGREECGSVARSYYRKGRWRSSACPIYLNYICEKVADQANCSAGWERYAESCYLQNNTKLRSWKTARTACQALGADLAVIGDAEEQSFIVRRLFSSYQSGDAWIGLRFKNGEWAWIDGKSTKNHTNWYPGEPRNSGYPHEDCVVIHATSITKGYWDNVNCEARVYGYICELAKANCPLYWTSFGGHCYKFNADGATWKDARRRCRVMNPDSDLISVDNQAEQAFIKSNFRVTSWIGLNAIKKPGTFRWLDSTAQPAYTRWFPREPNLRAEESCVQMYYWYGIKGRWNDQPCSKKNGYICKMPATGSSTYYDFKFKDSVYLMGLARMPKEYAKSYCQMLLGKNSGLLSVDSEDERKFIEGELNNRFGQRSYTFMGYYWLDGVYNENKTAGLFLFWDRYYPRSTTSTGVNCFAVYRRRNYGGTATIKLRTTACCTDYRFICEKHVGNASRYYDFNHGQSLYKIIQDQQKDPQTANSICGSQMKGGNLVQLDTTDEWTSISKEVTVRHMGENLEYWIGGNPHDVKKKISVNWAATLKAEHKCIYITKGKSSDLQLYPTVCSGQKSFLCERKLKAGENVIPTGNTQTATEKSTGNVKRYDGGCRGPCLALAIVFPFVVLGSIVIAAFATTYYYRAPFGVFSFRKDIDEVRLDVDS